MKKMSLFSGILFATSLFTTNAFAAGLCKTGNMKDCAAKLTRLQSSQEPQKFAESFDAICAANAKFKCIKKIVRGDMNEEIKFTQEERPKAHLFQAKLASEDYIFILEAK